MECMTNLADVALAPTAVFTPCRAEELPALQRTGVISGLATHAALELFGARC